MFKSKTPIIRPARRDERSLPPKFYLRKTEVVGRDLIGKCLVHTLPSGERLSGRIVETEAYLGVKDRACHSFGGRDTTRVKPLYLAGGVIYVYIIYGLHECFNVVTRAAGIPEAVLVRALEPIDGIERMMKNRGTSDVRNLCSGPGKLCQALQISRAHTGLSLIDSAVTIEDDDYHLDKKSIRSGPRVGIAYAGEAAAWPLRFWLDAHPHVSVAASRRGT